MIIALFALSRSASKVSSVINAAKSIIACVSPRLPSLVLRSGRRFILRLDPVIDDNHAAIL